MSDPENYLSPAGRRGEPGIGPCLITLQDFEGWLKGSPEYEIHVLGQSGSTDSLTSYQCVGEHAGAPYAFDQNALDWTGNVLVFSQTQLNNYRAAHTNQNIRLLAIEDDDDACQIRLDTNRLKT